MKPKMIFSLVNPSQTVTLIPYFSLVYMQYILNYRTLYIFSYKHLKCVAYGNNAPEIDAYWNSTRANVVLCVLSFWQIERGQGIKQ